MPAKISKLVLLSFSDFWHSRISYSRIFPGFVSRQAVCALRSQSVIGVNVNFAICLQVAATFGAVRERLFSEFSTRVRDEISAPIYMKDVTTQRNLKEC